MMRANVEMCYGVPHRTVRVPVRPWRRVYDWDYIELELVYSADAAAATTH